MTNFEMLKSMTVEEMAEFLVDIQNNGSEPDAIQHDGGEPSTVEMLEWLNSEAENDNKEEYPDYDDADIEMGFNPYCGCYDYDC